MAGERSGVCGGRCGLYPALNLQRMHDRGCMASGPGTVLRWGRGGRGRGPARWWAGPGKMHAESTACDDAICRGELQLEGPAKPWVSLVVDTPGGSGGLFERAMVDGFDHFFGLRRSRLLRCRSGFDDFAGAENQSQRQEQSRCRQPTVSASFQAYGSHFPSPVLARRAPPGDVHSCSNFRARNSVKRFLLVFWTRQWGKWLHGGATRRGQITPASVVQCIRSPPLAVCLPCAVQFPMALSSAPGGLCRARA